MLLERIKPFSEIIRASWQKTVQNFSAEFKPRQTFFSSNLDLRSQTSAESIKYNCAKDTLYSSGAPAN
jgi:hypothetical protein